MLAPRASQEAAQVLTRVSVITPFLNAGAHLLEAIESVRAQTEQDWEPLLVDDGSTDGPSIAACAARWTVDLSAHASVRREGGGRRAQPWIAAATGEFVAFLDADDVLERTCLR